MDPKVILITGASSGIGLATAVLLAKAGHKVYGGARRTAPMAPLEAAGGHALSLDVTDPVSCEAAVEAVIGAEGRIDVLVNNAGFGLYGAVEDMPEARARAQMEVNVFGLARMCQLVLPHMRKAGAGRIVNITSIGATVHTPLGAWYHGSKFFVEGFSHCLRIETQGKGIDVVQVAPGVIRSEFFGVVEQQLLEISGKGAYATLAKGVAEADQTMPSSEPADVAAVIEKAILARRPRAIYRAGRGSLLFYLIRRALPHRLFDRMVMSVT